MIHNASKVLVYDENSPTGLVWLVHASTRARAGSPAGSDFEGRYWRIRYKGSDDLVHRVVYRLAHGVIPDDAQIDHIDGNGKNNKISNLRAVPCALNQRNRRLSRLNRTGETGVHYCGKSLGYEAKVTLNGRSITKSFSIKKYGDEQAFCLAVDARSRMVEWLNKHGSGYSPTHGLRRVAAVT